MTIDPYRLDVVDDHENPPQARFYALRVLGAESGILVHSVSEVISTRGDLFNLAWCPD